jgi:hypothetical protein
MAHTIQNKTPVEVPVEVESFHQLALLLQVSEQR